MKLLITLFLFSTQAFAQLSPLDLSEEELNPETEEILLKKPEKYLRHESMIYDLNTDLGIRDQRTYTGTDSNRFSLSGHISGDYEHINDILGLDATYMRRSTRFDQIWYGAQVFQHNTYFDAVTQNHDSDSSSNPTSDAQLTRVGDSKATVMGLGLGVSYRFKLLLDFFETENVFENIDVYGNYIMFDDTFIKQKYKGYGLSANYGIHKRSGSSFFYGGKLSYNLASVTRDALGTESKSERSLTLGWFTLALELGFFF